MTETKSSSLKGGIPPSPPKTKLFIFTILMVGILLSLLELYNIARPFAVNHGVLNLVLFAGIVFIVIAYAMILKGGVPPAPPKTITNDVKGGIPPVPPNATSKSIKGGIPPATRKTP
jgi:hypothetical protein